MNLYLTHFFRKFTEVAYHEFAIYPFSLFQLISQVTPNLEDYIKQDRIGVIAYNDLYNSPLPSFPVDVTQ